MENYGRLCVRLAEVGITPAEVDALLRCERALSLFGERECNGEIERDEETGRVYHISRYNYKRCGRARDTETAALQRATAIASTHGLTVYHQTDPRGCALYILRPGDVRPGTDPAGIDYTRGVAICI